MLAGRALPAIGQIVAQHHIAIALYKQRPAFGAAGIFPQSNLARTIAGVFGARLMILRITSQKAATISPAQKYMS